MKIPKSALLSVVFVLLALSFMFSVTSNYNYSTTGYVSLPTNITTFSLSLMAILIIVFVLRGPGGSEVEYESIKGYKSGRRGDSDDEGDDIAYPMGDKPLYKIFQITRAYTSKAHLGNKYGKANPEYFINRIQPYIKDMLFKNSSYLDTLPAVKKTLLGIYNKGDFKNDKEGARKYLEELNREFNELFASYG